MFQESKPGQPLTAVIVGAGHRAVIYANFALANPDKLKIVGIADPNPLRREWCRKTYGFSEENMFESAEALASRPRFADAVINGTMDHQHVPTAIPLLKAGYHMLLEKPFAVNEEEMWELVQVAKETDRKVMICHVLRYAPFYKAIRQKILDGEIGDIVAIETVEHVSYHHMAVAYVRGKWRNYASCKATMLLAKCSHDLDLIMWMNSGNNPVSVASFGSNFQFHPGRMPEGAGKRCLVDCPREVEENCLYSAKKLFVDHPDRWTAYVWDNLEHLENPTLEDKIKTLKEDSLYGRCIYQCDNDTVDHQTVIINFANGVTASHNMIAGCARPMRSIHIIGTKGEISGVDQDQKFHLRKIDTRPGCEYSDEIIDLAAEGDLSAGHGGGDERLTEDFVSYIQGSAPSISCTTIDDSVNGHLCVYLADKSREANQVMPVVKKA